MTESTIRPDIIRVDKVKCGKATLLCAWDITEEQRTDPETKETITMYIYQSGWIDWTIQEPIGEIYIEIINGKQRLTDKGIEYINSNADEILSWLTPSCRC